MVDTSVQTSLAGSSVIENAYPSKSSSSSNLKLKKEKEKGKKTGPPSSLANLLEDNQTSSVLASMKPFIAFGDWYGSLKEPPRHGLFASLLASQVFDNLSSLVIVLNCASTAYSVDFSMQHLGDESSKEPEFLAYFNLFCLSWYTVELLLRLVVHRLFFFCNETVKWNLFDLVLVVMSLTELFSEMIAAPIVEGEEDSGEGSSASMAFMRVIRLMKFMRILRTIRVMRVFKDLAVIFQSLVNSFTALFWCFVMLAFKMYVFALIFLTGMLNHLQENGKDINDETMESIISQFGSLPRAMLTLYMSVTGGDDWGNTYAVVELTGLPYQLLFLFFTFFFSFAVFNILTGVFVDKAMTAAQPDLEELLFEQQRQNNRKAAELRELCGLADQDGTGKISRDEFLEMMGKEVVHAYMESIGMQVTQAEMFFDLLSGHGQDEVDADRFVQGCMNMKGTAKSIDMQIQRYEVAEISRHVGEIQHTLSALMVQMSGRGPLQTKIDDSQPKKVHAASTSPGLEEVLFTKPIDAHTEHATAAQSSQAPRDVPVPRGVPVEQTKQPANTSASDKQGNVKAELHTLCEELCDQFVSVMVPHLTESIAQLVERHVPKEVNDYDPTPRSVLQPSHVHLKFQQQTAAAADSTDGNSSLAREYGKALNWTSVSSSSTGRPGRPGPPPSAAEPAAPPGLPPAVAYATAPWQPANSLREAGRISGDPQDLRSGYRNGQQQQNHEPCPGTPNLFYYLGCASAPQIQ